MSVRHQTRQTNVGTYFSTPSGKLYYVSDILDNGTYAIENCKTNQIVLWTEQHLIARRDRVIVPKGGEQ